ncbi:MAG: hypothetical protein IPG96_06300 [Proteobacteria bacterium]|nr:hypothetical protein [Pseudomonadota bacterium]
MSTVSSREAPRIVDLVFETSARRAPWRGLWATLLAVGAALGLALLVARAEPSLSDWSAALALRLHEALAQDYALEPLPEPPAPHPPCPLRSWRRRHPARPRLCAAWRQPSAPGRSPPSPRRPPWPRPAPC